MESPYSYSYHSGMLSSLFQIVRADRPLPQSRDKIVDPEFGYLEPSRIPQGRVSIRQSLEFITSHTMNPGVVTASTIAKEYKLNPVAVQEILDNFHMLDLTMPKGSKAAALLEGADGRISQAVKPGTMQKLLARRTDKQKDDIAPVVSVDNQTSKPS